MLYHTLKVVNGRRKTEAKCSQDGAWILASRTRCNSSNFRHLWCRHPSHTPGRGMCPWRGRFMWPGLDNCSRMRWFIPSSLYCLEAKWTTESNRNIHTGCLEFNKMNSTSTSVFKDLTLKLAQICPILSFCVIKISKMPVFQEVWVLLVPVKKTLEHGVSKKFYVGSWNQSNSASTQDSFKIRF